MPTLQLLNPKVWLEIACVAIVAGLIWFAYHWAYSNGARDIQASFDAYKLNETKLALQQDEANRAKEQAFNTSLENLTNAYIKEKSAHAAAAAAAANSLRDLESSLGSPAPVDPATAIGLDDTARARAVVGECAATLQKVAELFDASEARLSALQTYVTSIIGQK